MKKKTEIAVKITDKNREKVRGILEMFGERLCSPEKTLEDWSYIGLDVHDSTWTGGNCLTYPWLIDKTIVKPKQLRNILAIDNLREGDVVVVRGIGYKGCEFVVSLNKLSSINNYNIHFLSNNYYNLTKSRIGYGSGVNGHFLRYATEEEKALLEPKKELTVGRWYKSWNRTYKGYDFSFYTGTNNDYGFHADNNEWYDEQFWIKYKTVPKWQEATPQEVEKALIKEAKRRGYKGGFVFDDRTNTLWNQQKNGNEIAILSNGKWVDVIKNDDKPQVGDVCKFWDNDESEFVIGFIHEIDFDYFYPYFTTNSSCYTNAKKLTQQEVIDLLF